MNNINIFNIANMLSLKHNIRDLIKLSFYSCILSLHYFTGLVSWSIIILVSLSIFYGSYSKFKITREDRKMIFVSSSFYLSLILSLSYTTDILNGLETLGKMSSLIVFPITIAFSKRVITKKVLRNGVIIFCANTSFIAIVSLLYLLLNFEVTDINNITSYKNIVRTELSDLIGMHPTYMSIYLLFSIGLYAYFLVYKVKKSIFPWLSFVTLAILNFVIALFMASRMPVIAFLLAVMILVFFILKKRFSIAIIFATFIASLFLIVNFEPLGSRFKEIVNTELEPPEGKAHNSTNIRIGIYACSFNTISTHWLFGIGVGDVQNSLNKCYKSFNTDVFSMRDYNTHNQYLYAWISSGLLGITSIFIMIVFPLYLSLKDKNYIYMFFLIFMGLLFLTENLLARQQGVVIYSAFNSVFLFCKRSYY